MTLPLFGQPTIDQMLAGQPTVSQPTVSQPLVSQPIVGQPVVGRAAPIVHTPPALGHHGEPPPVGEEALAVSVRNQVIDRLVALNHNHARVAFTSSGTPVCPHAVAFLYLDPIAQPPASGEPGRGWHKVVAATRLVPDTPDVRDLNTLLFRLTRLARERYLPTAGGFDPAVQMAPHHDPTTSPGSAYYIGLGVSTLDTRSTPWEQARAQAEDLDDLGGRVLALLADTTTILVDRQPARQARGELGVHATASLNYRDGIATRLWTRHPDTSTMPAEPELWQHLSTLHTLTYQQTPRRTL